MATNYVKIDNVGILDAGGSNFLKKNHNIQLKQQ